MVACQFNNHDYPSFNVYEDIEKGVSVSVWQWGYISDQLWALFAVVLDGLTDEVREEYDVCRQYCDL